MDVGKSTNKQHEKDKSTQPEVSSQLSEKEKKDKVSELIGSDLSGLMDVMMVISVEVGRTKMKLHELMDLSKGSIIELDKLAGEPLNILVNGKLIAYGEVVSINGKYGLRIVELANKSEPLG